jgi:hypothetical protein
MPKLDRNAPDYAERWIDAFIETDEGLTRTRQVAAVKAAAEGLDLEALLLADADEACRFMDAAARDLFLAEHGLEEVDNSLFRPGSTGSRYIDPRDCPADWLRHLITDRRRQRRHGDAERFEALYRERFGEPPDQSSKPV